MQDSFGFPRQVFKTWGSRFKGSGLIACDGFGASSLPGVFRFGRSCYGVRVSALGETFLRWFFLGVISLLIWVRNKATLLIWEFPKIGDPNIVP